MIRYRPFLNSDPPALADIWRRQLLARELMQPMTPAVFDQFVLSKPFFDREGLILALEDDKPVGFVHAGFGPNASRTWLDYETGVTCLLMVAPHAQRAKITAGLLDRSEEYLRKRGARTLRGGTAEQVCPFYLGLYGGSNSPGILLTDGVAIEAFRAAGYIEDRRQLILQRELAGFRPPMDRELIQLRRQYCLEPYPDPVPADWWEAAVFAQIERVRFLLTPRQGGSSCAEILFWDMEPMASGLGIHAMGFLGLSLAADLPGGVSPADLAAMVFGEAFRQLTSCGVMYVEIQADCSNAPLIDVCRRLGCREVNQGIRFRKPV